MARTGVAALVQGGIPPCAFGAPRQRAARQMLHTRRCAYTLARTPFAVTASGGVQSTVPVGAAAHAHLDADGGESRPGGSRVGTVLRALDCALWSVAMRRGVACPVGVGYRRGRTPYYIYHTI